MVKHVPKDKLLKETEKVLRELTDQDWDCVNEVELFDFVDKKLIVDEPEGYDQEDIIEYKKDIKRYTKKFLK